MCNYSGFPRVLSLAALLLIVLPVIACSPGKSEVGVPADATDDGRMSDAEPTPVAQPLDPATQALVEANNRLAFDLFERIGRGDDTSNLVFSPLSITTALAMTYAGARGDTAAEMGRVLYFQTVPDFHTTFAGLLRRLDRAKLTAETQLVQANGLWSATDLQKDFTDLIETYYGGKVAQLDLTNGAESSRVINGWVAKQTEQKIVDLVGPGDFGDLCRLVLTNAVYFKGAWDYPFNPDQTEDTTFTLTTGEVVQVPMMNRDLDADFVEGLSPDASAATPFYQNADFKMIELIYRDIKTSMICILPRKGNLNELEISPERLAEAILKLEEEGMEVEIPKFSFKLHAGIIDDLQALGLKLPFDSAADFSGMTGRKELYIDQILHQARIEVDEQGSEAAAATAVFMYAMSEFPIIEEPPSFIADRPFLFLIRDRPTGTILFLGRVMNPLESEPQ